MSWREQRWQARESAIVACALDLWREGGSEAVQMDQVSKRLGISKATLYQHFVSKEDVLLRMAVDVMRAVRAAVGREGEGLSPQQRWRQLLASLCRDHDALALAFSLHLPRGVREHSRYQRHRDALEEALLALVEALELEGACRDCPAPVLVQMVLSLGHDRWRALCRSKGATQAEIETSVLRFFGVEEARP